MAMTRRFLLVRHAEATGQEPSAKLSAKGKRIDDSNRLCKFIRGSFEIGKIFCSPFLRTRLTVSSLEMVPTIDDRLSECYHNDPEYNALNETAEDGTRRIIEFLRDHENNWKGTPVFDIIVSHGDLITLFLKHLDPEKFVYLQCSDLQRPDIFSVSFDSEDSIQISHILTGLNFKKES